MKHLIIASLLLLLPGVALAEFDTTTSTSTSTATATAGDTTNTITTTIGGGEGSGGGVNITHHKQYRIAPAVSIGAATGVDGVGLTTPFGGALFNKGNRFQQAYMLYNLKAANGMDCAREVAIMERETQETRFLGLIPLDTPFGLGQTKPWVEPKSAEPVVEKPAESTPPASYIVGETKPMSAQVDKKAVAEPLVAPNGILKGGVVSDPSKQGRNSVTGRFITQQEVSDNPNETELEAR